MTRPADGRPAGAAPVPCRIRARALAGALALLLGWLLPVVERGPEWRGMRGRDVTRLRWIWDPESKGSQPDGPHLAFGSLAFAPLALAVGAVAVATTLRGRACAIALLGVGVPGLILVGWLDAAAWQRVSGPDFTFANLLVLLAAAVAVAGIAAGNHVLRRSPDLRAARILTVLSLVALLGAASCPVETLGRPWLALAVSPGVWDRLWPFQAAAGLVAAYAVLAGLSLPAWGPARALRRATSIFGRCLCFVLPVAIYLALGTRVSAPFDVEENVAYRMGLALKAALLVLGAAAVVSSGLAGAVARPPAAAETGVRRLDAPSYDVERWVSRWVTVLATVLLAAFLVPVVWLPDHQLDRMVVHASWRVVRSEDPRTWAVLALPLLAVLAWVGSRRSRGRARGRLLVVLAAAALPALALATGCFRLGFDLVAGDSGIDSTRSLLLFVVALSATCAAVGNRWQHARPESTRASGLTVLGGGALLAAVLVASGAVPGWAGAPLRDGTASRLAPLLAFAASLAVYALLALAVAVPSLAGPRLSRARSLLGRALLALAPFALFVTAVLPAEGLDGVAALTFAVKATGLVVGVLGLLGVGWVAWVGSPDYAPAPQRRNS